MNKNPSAWSAHIDRVLSWLNSTVVFICGVAMVVLLAIFGWLVFGRYVLNQTPTWVEQLALLLVVLITFLMTAVGVREDWHLGVTVFRNIAPPRLRSVMLIITDLTIAVFGVVMMIVSWQLVQFGWSTNLPMLNIPEGVRTIPVVVCGALMFLFAGLRVLKRIIAFSRGDYAPDIDVTNLSKDM